ncbi:type I methionyl aminopeptidase [Candidatus Gracilibacteria bacterium]|nr:type I methionyl aminopeptidase [Candidatus Gracilibacteria bacterium]
MSKIIIKTPEQIEGIRKAGKLTAMTLDMIGTYVRAGVSTLELDNIMNTFILSNGGISACIDYKGGNKWGKGGYPRCTCISLNDVICHGIPRADEILKEGDILNIDVTTIVDGYFGDASRMYTVGNVSEKAKDLIAVTKKAWEIGIAEVRPGNFFGNIGYAISQFAESRGYSVVRDYTGHGVGLEFHEEPYVYHKAAKNTGPKMQAGMIFTIEPMINLGKYASKLDKDNWTAKTKDGSLSAQFEHTILVTEKGHEILTVV